MRLFVCEFITCGGMRDQPLPGPLRIEAETMLQALLSDLREINTIEVITTRDNRLSGVPESAVEIAAGDDIWRLWGECMQSCDAVWVIAPETEGILLKLRELAQNSDAIFIGCDANAIKLTTSKLKTARHLTALNIPCIETYRSHEGLPCSDNGWIVKPDDGVGTEDCYYFDDAGEFYRWRENIPDRERYVIQPYVAGVAGSISVLYHNNRVEILSCNEQKFSIKNGIGIHNGIIINGLKDSYGLIEPIAIKIGEAIPGLRGYAGVDIILTSAGVVVVEINPRLTTSYAGLRYALGINVAAQVLDIFNNVRTVNESIC